MIVFLLFWPLICSLTLITSNFLNLTPIQTLACLSVPSDFSLFWPLPKFLASNISKTGRAFKCNHMERQLPVPGGQWSTCKAASSTGSHENAYRDIKTGDCGLSTRNQGKVPCIYKVKELLANRIPKKGSKLRQGLIKLQFTQVKWISMRNLKEKTHLRPHSLEQQNVEPRTHHRIVGSNQISTTPAPLEVYEVWETTQSYDTLSMWHSAFHLAFVDKQSSTMAGA